MMNILILEDSAVQRRHLSDLLQRVRACAIREAENGKIALQLIENHTHFDLIFCDLEMPEMDGMEFLRHLAAMPQAPAVIPVSSQHRAVLNSVESMAQAHGLTVLGVIQKPATEQRLRQLLERLPVAVKKTASRNDASALTIEEIQEGLRLQQFYPVFQPKIALQDDRVIGVEALARWQHPELGMIAPAVFLPVIEINGLIDELTWSIIDQSATFCAAWRRAGLDLSVSVNISVDSLKDVTLANQLAERVKRNGLEPRHMVLEITESAMMDDIAHSLENLARLRIYGFQLAIDDFGTGYSSLQQLARVPFSELKIDKSFVHRATRKKTLRAILQSSLDLARKMNLVVTAEGVETLEDLQLLRALGCDQVQGYLIAKPMPGAELLPWLRQWAMQHAT